MWSILTTTGGSWEIRSIIKSLVGDDLSTPKMSRVFFSLMEREYYRSSDSSFAVIYDAIVHFSEGSITDNNLLFITTSELKRSLYPRIPSSSVKIDVLTDRITSVQDPRTWRTKYKTVSFAIYTMVILFFLQMSTSMAAETHHDIIESTLGDIKQYRETGKMKMSLPPSVRTRPSSINSITPYIRSVNEKLQLDHISRGSDEYDKRILDSDHFLMNTEKIISKSNYEIFAKGDYNDDVIETLDSWVNYMTTIINPIYTPSDTLKVVLADRYPGRRRGGQEDDIFLQGEYIPENDLLFVRVKNELDINKLDSKIEILVHELSHRAHLGRNDAAVNCRRAYMGDLVEDEKEPGLCRVSGLQLNSKLTREYLMTISDAVDGILYLGLPNQAISHEEALVYKKMIMDMKIQVAYENAQKNPDYEMYIRKYGMDYAMSNYMEFWAEASTAYLYKQGIRSFPNREWIEQKDPALLKLLEEVYSNAPEFIGE